MALGANKACPTTIETSWCLNARHHDARCAYCVNICPTEAIVIRGGSVSLDRMACNGCGLCLSNCPTEVLSSDAWNEKSLTGKLRNAPAQLCTLLCRHASKEVAAKVHAGRVGVCLGSLSPAVLFEAALSKDIELHCACSDDCASSCGFDVARKHVDLANEWLESVGSRHTVRLVQEALPKTTDDTEVTDPIRKKGRRPIRRKKEHEARALNADEQRLSRRDFLSGFVRQGSPLFSILFEEPLPVHDQAYEGFPKQVEKRIPERIQRLRASWNVSEQGTPSPWPLVELDTSACLACGACAQYCPTKTLSHTLAEGRLSISYTPGLCLDCRICELACTSGALRHSYCKTNEPFTTLTICTLPAKSCPRCGTPVLGEDQDLCYWCKGVPSTEEVIDCARNALLWK